MQQWINVLAPIQNAPPQHLAASQAAPDGAFRGVLLEMLLAGTVPAGGETAAQPANPLQPEGPNAKAATQPEALSLIPLPEALLPLEGVEAAQAESAGPPASVLAMLTAPVQSPPAAPALVQQPDAAQPQGQALIAAVLPADTALEAFVQKAVQGVAAEQAPPTPTLTPEGESEAPVRFQDLVRLVTGEEKSPSAGAAAPPPDPAAAAQPATVRSPQAPPHPPAAEPAAPQPPEAPFSLADLKPAAPQSAPATEVSPPPSPVQPEQVVRQVAKFLKVTLDGKRSEVRFQLHPEHLGQVAVRLVLQEGVVRANLLAQNQAVKAALEANMEQLRTRLADQGLKVEQIYVTVSGEGASGQPHHSHHREQRHFGQPGGGPPFHQGQEEGSPSQHDGPAARPQLAGVTGRRINTLA